MHISISDAAIKSQKTHVDIAGKNGLSHAGGEASALTKPIANVSPIERIGGMINAGRSKPITDSITNQTVKIHPFHTRKNFPIHWMTRIPLVNIPRIFQIYSMIVPMQTIRTSVKNIGNTKNTAKKDSAANIMKSPV